MFELYDAMFFVKSLKACSPCFCITNFVPFTHCNTRSSTTGKLQHIYSCNNYTKNLYFNRLLGYGIPYPQLIYHYLSLLSRPCCTNFYGTTFCLISNLIIHVLFILYVPVVIVLTLPLLLLINILLVTK